MDGLFEIILVRCRQCILVGEYCVSPYKSSTNKGLEHCSIEQIWRCCGVKNPKLEPKVDQNSQDNARSSWVWILALESFRSVQQIPLQGSE